MTVTDPRHADCTPIFVGMLLDTIGGHFDRHAAAHAALDDRLAELSRKLDAVAAGLPELSRQVGEVRAGAQELLAKLTALSASVSPPAATEAIPALPPVMSS